MKHLALALLLTLAAGCAALPATDTPTPAERTVIVEGPTVERTVIVERTVVRPSPSPAIRTIYINRTVERTVFVTPTATPTATPTPTPEPTFADGVEIDWFVFRQNVSYDGDGTMYELLVDVENHNDANATFGLRAEVNYTDSDGVRQTQAIFTGHDRWTAPGETEVRVRRAYVWPRHIPDATVSVELYEVEREGDG